MQLNRENGQWLARHTRLESELVQTRQAAHAQQCELDALRLTAAELHGLQARWGKMSKHWMPSELNLSKPGPIWLKSGIDANEPRRNSCEHRCV